MLENPIIRFIDEETVVLKESWSLRTRYGLLRVKPGAISDGGSIPHAFQWIPGFAKFEGDTLPGFFAHDQLYAAELCPRKDADQAMYDALRDNGVSWLRARICWLAVRRYGKGVWADHTPQGVETARKYAELIEAC